MKNIITLFILLISSYSHISFANEADSTTVRFTVENAWIAEAPPVSKVMVAYLTINNQSNQAITIVKAESDLYSSIEFHETVHENGLARMVRYSELLVPANDNLELKRGGKHLMLFNPTKRLKIGDTVTIRLTTADDTFKIISVPVKKVQY